MCAADRLPGQLDQEPADRSTTRRIRSRAAVAPPDIEGSATVRAPFAVRGDGVTAEQTSLPWREPGSARMSGRARVPDATAGGAIG